MLPHATTQRDRLRSPISEHLIGPLRIVFESDPFPENEYTQLHVQGALGKNLSLPSTYEQRPSKAIVGGILDMVLAFLSRAEADGLVQKHEWSLYYTVGCAPMQIEEGVMYVAFVASVISRPQRPIAIRFEPFSDELPKEVAEHMDSISMQIREAFPAWTRTRRERDNAESVADCLRLGLMEASMLFNHGEVSDTKH
jgi:hypothetical protein